MSDRIRSIRAWVAFATSLAAVVNAFVSAHQKDVTEFAAWMLVSIFCWGWNESVSSSRRKLEAERWQRGVDNFEYNQAHFLERDPRKQPIQG